MKSGKSDPRQRVAQGRVQERIEKKIGVSGEQVRRVKKILEEASEDQIRQLREEKLSIREVLNSLKSLNNPYEKVEVWTIDGKLMIREDFHKILPDLTNEQYLSLEKSILKHGFQDPIIVWNNIILDGHQRYKICCKHDIKYQIVDISDKIQNESDAKIFIIDRQLNRRDRSEYEKINFTNRERGTLEKEEKPILKSFTRNPLSAKLKGHKNAP